MIDSTISHFRILEKLGSGGMGDVYLARDVRLDRLVALKFLPVSAADDPSRLSRFLNEARCASALNHPNIAQIYEIDQTGQLHFIAMEYVRGRTLAEVIEQDILPIQEIVHIAVQIADALDSAHRAGLVHRDIKPGNIMLTKSGVKVLDFGLAKRVAAASVDSAPTMMDTNPGLVLGTVPYMSPEQALGHAVDHRSDVFSFGILVFQLTTRSLPFTGSSFTQIIDRICHGTPPRMVSLRFGVPADLESIVQKCLQKDAASRYQATRELLDDLRALKSGKTTRSNASDKLPAPKTVFIGRESEMEMLAARLNASPLVTLAGPGGIGKTRFAIEFAATHVDNFENGVSFVDLAPVHETEAIPRAVASAVAIAEDPGVPLDHSLKHGLAPRHALIVLDNCEHLIEACASLVGQLLNDCPRVKFLITSREPLTISGEDVWRIPSLAVPDRDIQDEPDLWARYSAIQLFVARATAVMPEFRLTKDNASFVASICRRLDGIPLAIELAAARIRILSPQQIDTRLENRFRLLSSATRDAPLRHQTLTAAMDWSYELLSEEEKVLFKRLSLFPGSWELEAVENICCGEGLDTCDAVDILSRLVEKSLVISEISAVGMRFRMLETVRAYAWQHLSAAGSTDIFSERFTDYFLKKAETTAQVLQGAQQASSMAAIELDYDNIRAAFSSIQLRDDKSLLGLRMVAALAQFWLAKGYFEEGTRWTRAALTHASDSGPGSEKARALNIAGNFAFFQGDLSLARSLYEQALAMRRSLGDKPGIAESLQNLGSVAASEADYAGACSFFEQGLQLWGEMGERRGIGICLNNLGTVHYNQNELGLASPLLEEALSIFRTLGDRRLAASALMNLGLIAAANGDYGTAERQLEESLLLRKDVADQRGVCASLTGLAGVKNASNNRTQANSLFREALMLCTKLNYRWAIAWTLEGLASTAVTERPEYAARVYGAAAALRELLQTPRPPVDRRNHEQSSKKLRETLGETVFSALWSEGRMMDLDSAIAYALESNATQRSPHA